MAFLDRAANRGSISTGYDIENSCRFEDTADVLTYTYSGEPTSQKIGTMSIWFKRSQILGNIGLFQFGDDGSGDYFATRITAHQDGGAAKSQLFYRSKISGTESTIGGSAAAIRDASAWYHLVIAIDTTQGTVANRFKPYLNGVEIPFGNTMVDNRSLITQNVDMVIGENGKYVLIGEGVYKWDGYIADVHYVDGQQLAASDFGETDQDSGIWKPKKYGGTYGNNGFFLEFKETGTSANSSGIGADTSGNGHHFTLTSIDANNQTTDTPTNNFATLNSNDHPDTAATYSEGNLRAAGGRENCCTMHITSGKWYYEWKVTDFGSGGYTTAYCGLLSYLYPTGTFGDTGGVGNWGYKDPVATAGDPITMGFRLYPGSHSCFKNSNDGASSNSMTGGQDFTFVAGTIIRVCIDYDNGAYWLGAWEGSPNSGNGSYIGGDGTENNGHGWLNHGASAGQSNPATGAYPSIGTGSAGTAQGRSTQDGSQSDASLLTTVPGPVRIWQHVYAGSNNSVVQLNYGNPPYTWSGSSYADANGYGKFQYEPPSGFYALCSKNLAEFG